MPTCTEIAVFEVTKANLARVIEVSEVLFSEINAENKNIIAHQIFTKIELSEEKPEEALKKNTVESEEKVVEVCWHLTWANAAAVQASKLKWPTYQSSAEIERLVGKKLFYSHFTVVIANP